MATKDWNGCGRGNLPSATWLAGPLAHRAGNVRDAGARLMRPDHRRIMFGRCGKATAKRSCEALARQSAIAESRPVAVPRALWLHPGQPRRDRQLAPDPWLASGVRFGRRLAPVRCGSGVIEKNIEVRIGRRFKRQGRSWTSATEPSTSLQLPLAPNSSHRLDPLVDAKPL